MDPEITLFELRELAQDLSWNNDEISIRMGELFQNLDTWITNGGFLPKDWEHRSGFDVFINPICGVPGCRDRHRDRHPGDYHLGDDYEEWIDGGS